MKIGVLGTGMVGTNLGTALIGLGHEVRLGSRTPDNPKARQWAARAGAGASTGTFESSAKFGDMIFFCVKGEAALEVLKQSGPGNYSGKTVVDLTNPLDFSRGMPPSLFVSNTNSLAEEIQRTIPHARVVKTLHIVTAEVMTDPGKTGGEPTMMMSGNDAEAKNQVRRILSALGWKDIIDLGDLTGARTTEMLLPVWLRLWGVLNDGHFGFKIVRK